MGHGSTDEVEMISSKLYSQFKQFANWSAPNIWVFIAQQTANAESMGSNPVEALTIFAGENLQLLKLRLQLR